MNVNVIIVGGGVVGLAIARSLSTHYDKIFLIEKNNNFGLETSSRNSEVIHSGIYYPPNSLKAKLSKEGNKRLYDYCDNKKVKYIKRGKYVIGFNDLDKKKLKILKNNAQNNGVKSELLNKNQIIERQPNIFAENALFFRNTGVVDSHGLMNSLVQDINSRNVHIVYKTIVKNISKIKDGYLVKIKNPDNSYDKISSKIVINSAGLESYNISKLVGIDNPRYKLHFWKGDYFSVTNTKKGILNSLIYPLPESNNEGLGIHTTIDFNGRLKLGPDASYIGETFNGNYIVNEANKEIFYKSVKKYLPFIQYENLQPDQSGIRPKLQMPGDKFRDFIICNESDKGFNNFINLIGIESPGLTASLAIGKYVRSLLN